MCQRERHELSPRWSIPPSTRTAERFAEQFRPSNRPLSRPHAFANSATANGHDIQIETEDSIQKLQRKNRTQTFPDPHCPDWPAWLPIDLRTNRCVASVSR